MITPGRWYDPISERWIMPRQPRIAATSSDAGVHHILQLERTAEIQRIWRTLVDSCASQ